MNGSVAKLEVAVQGIQAVAVRDGKGHLDTAKVELTVFQRRSGTLQ